MKKTVIFIMSLLLITSLFTGCGKKEVEKQDEAVTTDTTESTKTKKVIENAKEVTEEVTKETTKETTQDTENQEIMEGTEETEVNGTWTLSENGDTLRLDGTITETSYDDFMKVFNSDVKTLVINSGGGDTYSGLRIAKVIYDSKIDVVVDKICASSAANYLFMAGRNKVVKEGSLLMFHGGVNSFDVKNLEEELKNQGASEKMIEEQKGYITMQRKLEKDFYELVGVDLKLLEYSHVITEKVGFWAPSPEVLSSFGVTNIEKMWYPATDEEFKKTVTSINEMMGTNTTVSNEAVEK
ncbi:hypothetical protein [Vallitalea guaymasensis]|uniref:hypothetical protein n=1 Tax=Vallitalea guaymasensis TaxID=1185412 RepID=UPI00272D9489|nr:hypothetical protein [Vallitalea guaymasensis]